MRIYGGKARGKRLCYKPKKNLRPTSGKVKEALFNILASKLPGSSFLDLYAGTGSIGLEALSRGARFCVFVEKSTTSLRLLRQNMEQSNFRGIIISADAIHSFPRLVELKELFDLVFLDPPYEKGLVRITLSRLVHASILTDHAIIVAEHSVRENSGEISGLELIRSYRYGDTVLSLYRRKGSD